MYCEKAQSSQSINCETVHLFIYIFFAQEKNSGQLNYYFCSHHAHHTLYFITQVVLLYCLAAFDFIYIDNNHLYCYYCLTKKVVQTNTWQIVQCPGKVQTFNSHYRLILSDLGNTFSQAFWQNTQIWQYLGHILIHIALDN